MAVFDPTQSKTGALATIVKAVPAAAKAVQGRLKQFDKDTGGLLRSAIPGFGSNFYDAKGDPIVRTEPAKPTEPTAPPAPPASPAQDANAPAPVGLNAPAAGGPPVQDEKANQLAMLDQLYAQYQGMRGAPTVRMNQDIREGIAGQQRAARGVLEAIGAEEPGQQAARAGMMAEGQRYIAGLQKLRGEQEQLFGARRAAMAEDEARMAQAEKSFDASRVIREVGSSPLSTGALSFAAGLVGALKGQAGDMGPNQILGEVDKAIERDVMNQQTEYGRMKEGIAGRRTNFVDAMKMGASENEALAAATMASMDQHKRALEFAQQRITGAKEKGAIKEAISQLDMQRGKIQMDIDLKNAANYVAMNKSRLAGMAGVLESRAKLLGMDPEARQKATAQAASLMDKGFDDALRSAKGVGRVRSLMMELSPQKQREVWDTSVGNILMKAANSMEAKEAGKDSNAVLAAIGKFISAEMKGAYSPQQIQMLNLAQKLVNEELRNISGGSVTDGENIRNLLSRNWSSYEGFQNWIDGAESDARSALNKYAVQSKYADPNVSTILDNVMLPAVAEMDKYNQWKSSQPFYTKGNAK